jgi:hypothetical protein
MPHPRPWHAALYVDLVILAQLAAALGQARCPARGVRRLRDEISGSSVAAWPAWPGNALGAWRQCPDAERAAKYA